MTDYFIDYHFENNIYPTFEEYKEEWNKKSSPKSKNKSDEELRDKYDTLLAKSVSIVESAERKHELEVLKKEASKSLKSVLSFLLNTRTKKLRRTPGFNYRNLPDASRKRFKMFADDMMKNTIAASDVGDAKKIYKLSANLPKVIKNTENNYMLGDVVHAVRSTLIRKTLGDAASEKAEEIEKIKNNPDISEDAKNAMIDVITNAIIRESVDSMMRVGEEDGVEILQQQMEGNTTSSISEPENSVNYNAIVSEEIKERVFNDPEVAGLFGLSISLPVKEVIDRIPADFSNQKDFKPILTPPSKFIKSPPVSLPPVPDVSEPVPKPFWTNNKLAAVGALAFLAGLYGLYKYFEPTEKLDDIISDEEFEARKLEGYIPPEASKQEFVEAFNMTTPEKLENFEKTRNFLDFIKPTTGRQDNEASRMLAENYSNPLSENYDILRLPEIIGSMIYYNYIAETPTYVMPEPFILGYETPSFPSDYEPPATITGILAPPQSINSITRTNNFGLLAPPQTLSSISILDNLNKNAIPLPPPPQEINNNYTKETSPNIMSFDTPYKNYEDLPEYMKVYITREEFNASMKNEGTINRLVSRHNRGVSDVRNGLLSDKVELVPREKIPVIRPEKFLSSFPIAVPNSTPESFPRQPAQFMIGTGTILRKGKLRKSRLEYGEQDLPNNVELIGSETTLVKKIKPIPKY